MRAEAMTEADPVNPMRVFFEASSRLPDDTILAADSGSAANWYARQIKMRGTMRGSLSGNLATMGPAVPYGIGAKFAHPDRPVVVFEGDGAMQMNGLAELITIQRYWREWADPRLVVVVLHNDDLNQVTWEMRAMEGIPRFEASQSLPDVDYAAFARSLGLAGVYIADPEQLGPAWDTALSAQVPDGARRTDRPGHPADPAARDPGTGHQHREVRPQRRRRPLGRRQGRRPDQAGRAATELRPVSRWPL